jgi:hypothetical protein
MDISDLLKMFSGGHDQGSIPPPLANAQPGEGGAPTPIPNAPTMGAAPQGVGELLGASPSAMASNDPAALSAPPPPPAPMADESSLGMPAAPQPSTPPSTDSGLGGFLSHMVSKATARDPDTGMSFMDKLGDLGGTMTDLSGSTQGAARGYERDAAGRVKATQDDAQRQQIAQMADHLGMSPREKLLFMANPDAWAKANADRLGFHDVAGGHTILEGDPSAGGSTGFAPDVGVQNGVGFTATPGKTTATGTLPVSPEQQLKADLAQASETALAKYHEVMGRAATANAGANVTRANKPPALGNGGSWLPQGAKVVGVGRQ